MMYPAMNPVAFQIHPSIEKNPVAGHLSFVENSPVQPLPKQKTKQCRSHILPEILSMMLSDIFQLSTRQSKQE